MERRDLVQRFVEAINAADLEAICGLMTEDHCFIDSDGTETRGRRAMHEAWAGYFALVHGYRIEVRETFANGGTVVLIGLARGTIASAGSPGPDDLWEVPAAWRAVVDGERVAVWQVFVNPEPIRRAMSRKAPDCR